MKLFVVFVLTFLCSSAIALNCYTCSDGEEVAIKICLDAPENSTISDCNKKYCTIIRQEYKDPQGKVASIYRGCDNNPLHMNDVIEDETYWFFYTACQEPLCNGGSGKPEEFNFL